MLFDPLTSKSRKVNGAPVANFQRLGHPRAQQLNYWKNKEQFLVLKTAAKIVLAVPFFSIEETI